MRALSDIAHNFRGNGLNNVITGGGGNDILHLRDGGDDTVIGGSGNDAIYFGGRLSARRRSRRRRRDGTSSAFRAITALGPATTFTLGPSHLVNIEMLVLMSGGRPALRRHDRQFLQLQPRTVDCNVAAGQQLTVSFNTLRFGENVRFDGSAETDGSFLTYGGLGNDILTGGQQNDAFYFGADGRFGSGDRVDGQGGTSTSWDFRAITAAPGR